MKDDRKNQLHVRVTEEELTWLKELAAPDSLTVSAALRKLLRERWAKEFPERAVELKREIGSS